MAVGPKSTTKLTSSNESLATPFFLYHKTPKTHMADGDRFAFSAEWYDAPAAMTRKYAVLFFPKDETVELVDLKSKKVFLKRAKAEGVRADTLYIGAAVNIMSRQMKIVDFGDDYTRKALGTRRENTLVVLKQGDIPRCGAIIDALCSSGLVLAHVRMGYISPPDAEELLGDRDAPSFATVAGQLSDGPVIALGLLGESACATVARIVSSSSAYSSPDAATAARQAALVFGESSVVLPSPAFEQSTLCLIKPHAVASGLAGRIIDAVVQKGFRLGALQSFTLDTASASEFLEVYKGVVAEYPAMVAALTAGTSIALEVVGDGDVHALFREFVGPTDPEIARHLRPATLRARFGKDRVANAVHCTDLPEDVPLEVDYFFKILA
eukprot:m.27788 g.27788  ORF g.27788 m.27788 type:complete len:382 (+) comp9040_c0_seq1:1572-2717(+)